MTRSNRSPGLALAFLISAIATTGCANGAPAATGAGATPAPATAMPGSLPPTASSVPTTAPTKGGTAGKAQVDLLFSGTRAITAKGTAGKCKGLTRADGTVSFGFEATEADYPGLGLSYSMANLSGDFVDIKWVLGNDISYGDPGSGITLSADHHMVTLDVELLPFTTPGQPTPGPEHVKGTITCS